LEEALANAFRFVVGLLSNIFASFLKSFAAVLEHGSGSGGRTVAGGDAVLRSVHELGKGLSELADHLQSA